MGAIQTTGYDLLGQEGEPFLGREDHVQKPFVIVSFSPVFEESLRT